MFVLLVVFLLFYHSRWHKTHKATQRRRRKKCINLFLRCCCRLQHPFYVLSVSLNISWVIIFHLSQSKLLTIRYVYSCHSSRNYLTNIQTKSNFTAIFDTHTHTHGANKNCCNFGYVFLGFFVYISLIWSLWECVCVQYNSIVSRRDTNLSNNQFKSVNEKRLFSVSLFLFFCCIFRPNFPFGFRSKWTTRDTTSINII